jgi:hypothetical protein
MVFVGTFIWVLNLCLMNVLCQWAFACKTEDFYQNLNLVQAGMFIVMTSLFMDERRQVVTPPPDRLANEIGVINVIGGFFVLGYFIVVVPNQHSYVETQNLLFCMMGGIVGAFSFNHFRRLFRHEVADAEYLKVLVAVIMKVNKVRSSWNIRA